MHIMKILLLSSSLFLVTACSDPSNSESTNSEPANSEPSHSHDDGGHSH